MLFLLRSTRQSLRLSKGIGVSLIVENFEPRSREAHILLHHIGFNFPFSSLFFAFPWSREDAIDATPMHKPPSSVLSCFHKSASKQGAGTSDAQHPPTQRTHRPLSLSFAHSLARSMHCNFATPATTRRTYDGIQINAIVTATDCRAKAAFPRAATVRMLLRNQLAIYCP